MFAKIFPPRFEYELGRSGAAAAVERSSPSIRGRYLIRSRHLMSGSVLDRQVEATVPLMAKAAV